MPKVKSLTDNVENNICDEVNLLLYVLISLIINSKLAPTIKGIKLPYTAVTGFFYLHLLYEIAKYILKVY